MLTQKHKMAIELNLGQNIILPHYSPNSQKTTSVSKVKNGYFENLSEYHNIIMYYQLSDRISFGIRAGMQSYIWNWSIQPNLKQSGVGVSSMGRYSTSRLYNFQLIAKQMIPISGRLFASHEIALGAIVYNGTKDLVDTTTPNWFARYPNTISKEILIIANPAKESKGLHLIGSYNLGLQFQFTKMLYTTTKIGYQLGFNSIWKQTVRIDRQWENKSEMYHTKINGNTISYQIGFGINF